MDSLTSILLGNFIASLSIPLVFFFLNAVSKRYRRRLSEELRAKEEQYQVRWQEKLDSRREDFSEALNSPHKNSRFFLPALTSTLMLGMVTALFPLVFSLSRLRTQWIALILLISLLALFILCSRMGALSWYQDRPRRGEEKTIE